jgi:hypothetical protein
MVPRENPGKEDLWDLLETLDKMGILDPKEFREIRAKLVRLDLVVLQGNKEQKGLREKTPK